MNNLHVSVIMIIMFRISNLREDIPLPHGTCKDLATHNIGLDMSVNILSVGCWHSSTSR